jgi:Flp pilus assembly protein protease CpaA
VIVALLVLISVNDIRHKRIPNILVLALLLTSLGSPHPRLEPIFLTLSVLLSVCFQLVSRCGSGDVKLLIVLSNLVVGGAHISAYLLMVCVGAMISIAIHYMRTRSFEGDIAFAPALCGAVLAVRPLSIG